MISNVIVYFEKQKQSRSKFVELICTVRGIVGQKVYIQTFYLYIPPQLDNKDRKPWIFNNIKYLGMNLTKNVQVENETLLIEL